MSLWTPQGTRRRRGAQGDSSLLDGLVAWVPLDQASGNDRSMGTPQAFEVTENGSPGSSTNHPNGAGAGVVRDFESNSNQFFRVTPAASFFLGDASFSACIWAYDENAIFVARNMAGSHGGAGTRSWSITESAGALLTCQISADGTTFTTVSQAGWVGQAWFFVYVEYDATNDLVGISVDNAALTTAAHAGGASTAATFFFLGTRASSGTRWDGLLSSFGMWSRVLTAAERTALYRARGMYHPPFDGIGL